MILSWKIEQRGDINVLVWLVDGGVRPANVTEIEAWERIRELVGALKSVRDGLDDERDLGIVDAAVSGE